MHDDFLRYLHNDQEPVTLDEVTYKDIMQEINPANLPHRDYAPLIPYVRFVGYKRNIFKFFVPNKYNGWETYIRFDEFANEILDTRANPVEASRLLLWSGNISVHCGCPAYRYWGYQYIMTQLDGAIEPEGRYPSIRNPNLKGVVCKHLNRTMKVLPFHLGDIASAIREQRSRMVAVSQTPDAPPETKQAAVLFAKQEDSINSRVTSVDWQSQPDDAWAVLSTQQKRRVLRSILAKTKDRPTTGTAPAGGTKFQPVAGSVRQKIMSVDIDDNPDAAWVLFGSDQKVRVLKSVVSKSKSRSST